MLAAVAGCLMSVCIAFAGTVDIATNFFGLVVTVIAKGLLNAADIVLEPLLEITTMSTGMYPALYPDLTTVTTSAISSFRQLTLSRT